MCWVCEQYGNGQKWYLNPENYARRLYKVRKEGTESMGSDADPQAAGMGAGVVAELVKARISGDLEWEEEIKREALEHAYKTHFGQVVTLDEYLQILDIAYPLAKMTCGCRRVQRGMPDEENFTCMGIGPGMYKWERWPETYRGGVEFITPEEAKQWALMNHKEGRVQTVDVFGTPYIGGLCQCEYPGCVAVRNRIDYDFKFLLKGHTVAKVDREKCTGCKICLGRCQFKALNLEVYTNKAYVDMDQCFGCGLCVTACPSGALELFDRESMPGLAENW